MEEFTVGFVPVIVFILFCIAVIGAVLKLKIVDELYEDEVLAEAKEIRSFVKRKEMEDFLKNISK